MSLLMDALRKAEQAKKQDQIGSATPRTEATAEAAATSPEPKDLDLKLEISEDPASQAPGKPEEAVADFILSLEEDPQVEVMGPAPALENVAAGEMADSVAPPLLPIKTAEDATQKITSPSSNQTSSTSEPASPQLPDDKPMAELKRGAHNFFAAKNEHLRRSSRKRLIVLSLTLTGGIALGVAGYLFFNHQQPSSLTIPIVVTNQDAQQPEAPLPYPAQATDPESQNQDAPATDSAPASLATSNQEASAIKPPGLPPPAKIKDSTRQASEGFPVVSGVTPTAPAGSSPPQERISKTPAKPTFTRSRGDVTDKVDSSLLAAHAAYQRGDIQEAGNHYQQVLRANQAHRGAMLGLAAIAVQRGETTIARGYYLRLLDLDPSDPLARTGLLSITPVDDPAQRESDLKLLLVKNPDIAPLHFNLGNLYASQQRWNEAQHCYFRAVETAMKNGRQAEALPDYYYNLAVSLDRMGQPRQAAGYYQEALQSLNGRTAGFSSESARMRLEQIRNLAQGEQKLPDILP